MNIEDFAREIYSDLGPGYSERVYHNAMEVLLRERGIPYESERVVLIKFKGHVIGNLRIDYQENLKPLVFLYLIIL
mgnify:CR=1 FL=1